MTIIEKIGQFNRFGSKLGLERMEGILSMLGNPQEKLKVIHVGGTNGKGSTCRFIYNILIENGYKVGLYTSPFIERFTERIEINREEISEEDLEAIGLEVIEKAKEYFKQTGDQATEFEIVTIIGLVYFARKDLDFTILEVGLGGTGDSTNVINKTLISVITSISYDHMDRLGETLEEIAGEKAGIIKERTPVIANVDALEAKKVIARKAYEKNSLLYDISKIKYRIDEQSCSHTIFSTKIEDTDFRDVKITLLGAHQVSNAITALASIEVLRKNGIIKVNRNDVYKGLAMTKNKGRLEILAGNTPIVIDGAHNLAAFQMLNKNIKEMFPNKKPLVVIGILKSKDSEDVLNEIVNLGDDFIVVTPECQGAMDCKDLELKISSYKNKNIIASGTVDEGKKLIQNIKKEYEYVLVTGSLYYIGEMLHLEEA